MLVRLAESIAVPYPIVLVVGGLAIGLVPELPDLELEPDVVFLVFLPPLLHAAAGTRRRASCARRSARWRCSRSGSCSSTMGAVAVVAHAIVPG